MTCFRRLSILAIAATLIAGCGANLAANPSSSISAAVPTSTPAASTEPGPSTSPGPARTPIPLGTPNPSPAAEPECPQMPRPADPVVLLYSRSLMDAAELQLTSVSPIADPGLVRTLPPREVDQPTMRFVGGQEARLDLFYTEVGWYSFSVTSALRAKLTPHGGSPIDLPVRIEQHPVGAGWMSVVTVTLPDLDTNGTLDVEVEWYDHCFLFQGIASSPVRVYGSAAVVACAPRRGAAFDELYDVFAPPIRLGAVDADIVPWQFAGKVTSLSFSGDTLPPYTSFSRDSPLLGASPSATIAVSNPNDNLDLGVQGETLDLGVDAEPDVIFFRRAPLIRWLEAGWIHGEEPEAGVVFRSELVEHPNGTFSFEVPTEPGRYAAQVAFEYDSACSFGTAGTAVGIDIVAP